MTKKIAIVDYGLGNILSIKRAFEQFRVECMLIDNPALLHHFDAIILPGVGAFKDGMAGLKKIGFIEEIRHFVHFKKPILGICLGMQLLFEQSEEFGCHAGLGLIEGRVMRLPLLTTNNESHRIPHVGWSSLTKTFAHPLFSSLKNSDEYYFCHSYSAYPVDEKNITATYDYGGHRITAAVEKDHIYGFQFHPEKSGKAGLDLIKNFLYFAELLTE